MNDSTVSLVTAATRKILNFVNAGPCLEALIE